WQQNSDWPQYSF
nr:immunoglobulin light chain junction region [Macaca mulatta]